MASKLLEVKRLRRFNASLQDKKPHSFLLFVILYAVKSLFDYLFVFVIVFVRSFLLQCGGRPALWLDPKNREKRNILINVLATSVVTYILHLSKLYTTFLSFSVTL